MFQDKGGIVSVVAGGWSVSQVDMAKIPGTIIAVNDAAYRLPRFDIAVSMDRLWTENRWAFLKERACETWLRRSAVQNIPEAKHVDTRPDWLRVFECDHEDAGFVVASDRLNGTNSGGCALNRAYLLVPRVLYLFGFDMQKGPNGQAHWFPPYPWQPQSTKPAKLYEWSREFENAAASFRAIKTNVVNVSTRTLIKCFPIKTPAQLGLAEMSAA